MCNFEDYVDKMTFENCNLFKRSFTNEGLGYTFNNERDELLLKRSYRSSTMFQNRKVDTVLMKAASPDHSLRTVIETSAEERLRWEKSFSNDDDGDYNLKPRFIHLSVHNPNQPADMRSRSFKVPLGQSTTVYLYPRGREIDKSGKELTESQRKCRLNEDTQDMKIFNVYTKAACIFECKLKYSEAKCGCRPWDYPNNSDEKVKMASKAANVILKYIY